MRDIKGIRPVSWQPRKTTAEDRRACLVLSTLNKTRKGPLRTWQVCRDPRELNV
jgi:hypothetical protein